MPEPPPPCALRSAALLCRPALCRPALCRPALCRPALRVHLRANRAAPPLPLTPRPPGAPSLCSYAFGLIIGARFAAMVVGPAVGGILYEWGGFPLPFLVSGLMFLVLAVLTMYVGATTPLNAGGGAPASSSVARLLGLKGVFMMVSAALRTSPDTSLVS